MGMGRRRRMENLGKSRGRRHCQAHLGKPSAATVMASAQSLEVSFKASQRDWDNREFISAIQFSVLKMVEFLNRFGTTVHMCDCVH